MSEGSTLVSIRLPDELRQQVDEIAVATQRSRSFIVKEAVASYVADRKAYLDAVDEALKDANEGIFVSGDAVDAWLRSWGTESTLPVPQADIFPVDEK